MVGHVIKYVRGWRFAPACCAAQNVRRARPMAALFMALAAARRARVGTAQAVSNLSASASTAITLKRQVPAERVPPVHFHQSFVAISRSTRFATAQKAPPNHSLNRTHHGLRQIAGVRRLRHLRTPAICRKPWRSG
jgi:hypothetical protein